jgi:hypothetical protein
VIGGAASSQELVCKEFTPKCCSIIEVVLISEMPPVILTAAEEKTIRVIRADLNWRGSYNLVDPSVPERIG